MYHFNKRSLKRSRIDTINSFKKNFKIFSRPITVYCCLNSELLFGVNFWLRMMYIFILKFSNASKAYISRSVINFFSES